MGPTDSTDHRYDAFVSYRHVEPDRGWATWLHRSLETYRTPKPLVRRGVAARIRRVFRDEEELSASADLSREIDEALEQSRFLIVVCSPRTPPSEWVNQEVVRFRELRRHDRILALLIEGEPCDSFPRALCELDSDGSDAGVEPLAADVRPQSGDPLALRKRTARLRLCSALLGCRFDDLRQRDQERRRGRLLAASGALLVLALVLVGLTVFAFHERDQKGRALGNVLRLADAKKVRDLLDEVDRLWPLHPDRADGMRAWRGRAEVVMQNRPGHVERLRRLRERGHRHDSGWSFADDGDAWQHQVLEDLVGGLETLGGVDASGRGAMAAVGERLDFVSNLRKRSIEDHAALWRETVGSIADRQENPLYRGLVIPPQLGLVPLGKDPFSELFEFAHLGSGSLPERIPGTRELTQSDDGAIVLVLIPPGRFAMGAQASDPDGGNFDEAALPGEAPVHIVEVAAFFLARTECTQSQWAALTRGLHPSARRPGTSWGHKEISARNPVEQVSWSEATRWLSRNGLGLPREAEWEYACRAGTTDPWFTGVTPDTLAGHPSEASANIADRYCKENGGPEDWTYTVACNDGHTVHARVGSFYPNDFGLHDVHGNVWEWCLDPLDGDGMRRVGADAAEPGRVVRGGGWGDTAAYARSAYRGAHPPGYRDGDVGLRPAREVLP